MYAFQEYKTLNPLKQFKAQPKLFLKYIKSNFRINFPSKSTLYMHTLKI